MKRKIGILTNFDERCGNAEYARDLERYLKPYYDVFRTPVPVFPVDVMIINWHPAVVNADKELVNAFKQSGVKTLLILQNSFVAEQIEKPFGVDIVVAHEPMGDNVVYIPHAIPDVDVSDIAYASNIVGRLIGTAGYQSPWKRLEVLAEAAKRTDCICRVIAPCHPWIPEEYVTRCMQYVSAQIISSYRPVDEVVKSLADCILNIFWFQSQSIEDRLGQTGSARMGIAARRPMIISRHHKFRTIIDEYPDEFYIADSEEQVYEMSKEILYNPKVARKPERIVEEQNWSKIALKYKEVIDSL